MQLNQSEFDQRKSSGELRIALIGMSNIGKSYIATRIAKSEGFVCIDVDNRIQNHMGNPSMAKMAKWMGHPFGTGYQGKADEYLALEQKFTINGVHLAKNQILDTTGSVIHIQADALKILKNNYLVVYIKANNTDIQILIDRYFALPKPTIWGDKYRKIEGKTDKQSLISCYPDMLAARAMQYAKLADITIDAAELTQTTLKDRDILPLLRTKLS